MRWVKEVEMATFEDDLKTSHSIFGDQFPNFEIFDAKIASSLKKITPNSNFEKRINLEEQKAQFDDRFFLVKHIAFMIFEYVRVTLISSAKI